MRCYTIEEKSRAVADAKYRRDRALVQARNARWFGQGRAHRENLIRDALHWRAILRATKAAPVE